MPVYANYLINPSFETATTGWSSPDGASISRNTQYKQSGDYSLRISGTTNHNTTRSVQTTVSIDSAGPFTLSGYLLNRNAQRGSQYSKFVVNVYDMLHTENPEQRQQVATLTVNGTGRWALRNMTPRAGSNRLVVEFQIGNTYYEAGHYEYHGPYQRYFWGEDYPDWWSHYQAALNFANTKYNATISSVGSVGPNGSGLGAYIVTYYERSWVPTVSGGSVEVWLDALMLEQAETESAYVDGDTPGHTWTGQPHASATLGIAQLEASGTAISTGSLEILTLLLPEAHGTATSTGSLEAELIGLEAHGTATSTGSCLIGPYGPMEAAGVAFSSGGADIYAVIAFEISGTATSTGTAKADPTYLIMMTGTATSTGSLELSYPPDAEAHGTATSTGTAEIAIAGQLEAFGTTSSTGDLEIGQFVPAGAFSDFAIFGLTENDPLMSITAKSNGPINTGANNAEWVRVYGEVVAPNEQPTSNGVLWDRAAYVVPGIRFNSVGAGDWQEFTQYQVEISGPSGPGIYRYANSYVPYVYPDRLNLAATEIQISYPDQPPGTSTTDTSPFDGDTNPALKVVCPVSGIDEAYAEYNTLKPRGWYTASFYAKLSDGMSDLKFVVRDPESGMQLGRTASWLEAEDDEDLGDGWRRLVVVFQAPADGAVATFWIPEITQPQDVDQEFLIAGHLMEEGVTPKEYFWFEEGNIDLWRRYGYNDASGGTFKYTDFLRRSYIIKEALDNSAPIGVTVEFPEFGRIPHFDA